MSNETDPIIKEFVARLFAGRKGHGGGPCMRRVLYQEDLENVCQAAFDLGRQQADQPMPQLLGWLLDHLPELHVQTTEPCKQDPTQTIGQARWLHTVGMDAVHYPWAPGERFKLVSVLWHLIKKRSKETAKKMKGR
jgi:hypothetical protein